MTTLNRSTTIPGHDGIARLLAAGDAVWQVVAACLRAWQVARARQELHDLSDRTLKDIGLTRSEIDALFR